MAATCDVSFDEMAIALSYISLGGSAAAPASSARGLPSLAPVKKEKKEKKKAVAADDDVSTEPRKEIADEACFRRGWFVSRAAGVVRWQDSRHPCTVDFVVHFPLRRKPPPLMYHVGGFGLPSLF